jgi:aminoglycoside 6'-N-acetyltransferase I
MQLRRLSPEDESLVLSTEAGLFDNEIQPALTAEFLSDPRHHLIVAVERGAIIGFLSALHYVHPDKRPQLWINEVAVATANRKMGVGKALIEAALSLARELGCQEAWALTDEDNQPANALYSSAGGTASSQRMYSFDLADWR